jgi:DNA polymerase III delta subunit
MAMKAPPRKEKIRLLGQSSRWLGLRAPKSAYDALVKLARLDRRSLNQELVFLIEQEAGKRLK